jgi:arsenite-transporting ATPase
MKTHPLQGPAWRGPALTRLLTAGALGNQAGQMRTILFMGKGGVGKTSVAAATALRAAELGYQTLVMSTDPAHSLSDAFDLPLGWEPTAITAHLFGQEIDVQRELETHWAEVRNYITALFTAQGLQEAVAEEIAIFPGMEEMASLLELKRIQNAGQYEVVIVDCAPTGATLGLLSLPDVVRWYMKRLFPWHRRAVGVVRPMARHLLPFPLPEEEFYEAIAELYGKVGELKELLTDSERTSLRLVLNLERMVLQETRRAYTYASLFGLAVDAILINRVLPQEVTEAYFREWKALQQEYLQEVEESFAPLPIFQARLFEREVVGCEALQKMAVALYGDTDPTQVFYPTSPMKIQKEEGEYQLALTLPFVTKGEVDLRRLGEELLVRVGAYKRHLFLPHALARRQVVGARLEQAQLTIRFAEAEGPPW